jgi:hypothetical protein
MRRRDFAIGLLLAATTQSVRAEEQAKQHRIAIVIPPVPSLASTTRALTSIGLFGRSCAGWAMSKDKTSPSRAIPAKGGPRAMPTSSARSSTATRR